MPHDLRTTSAIDRRIPRRLLASAATVALALVVAACGTSATPAPSATPTAAPTGIPSPTPSPVAASPSPSPSPAASASAAPSASPGSSPATEAEAIAAIEAQVAAIRALDPLAPVDTTVVDEAAAKEILAEDFRALNTTQSLADEQLLLEGLGLWTTDRSLEDLSLEFLDSQVLGFYRDTDKKLYIVSRTGGFGPLERFTAAHELTHALQDQHFDLGSLGLDRAGEGDRALAIRALVEGDASLASTYWMQGNMSVQDLLKIAGTALDPAQQAVLDDLPAVMREELLFPYSDGLTFVMRLQQEGWSKVDDAYRDLPASTEQVLHPEKYLAGEQPIDVPLPTDLAKRLGPGWSLATEDTLGELNLRSWLSTLGGSAAKGAASDWGGDRIGLYRGPDGAWAIVLATAWDTPEASDRFTGAALEALGALPHADLLSGAQGPVVLIGSDEKVLDALRLEALAP